MAISAIQRGLFEEEIKTLPSVVNVASVPHRSPFRYPGGKTWLVPYFRSWASQYEVFDQIVDPFCGGGIISLTAVMEGMAKKAVMGEIDPHVSAVWRTIFNGGGDRLINRIRRYELSRENVLRDLSKSPKDDVTHAFQTILRNRVQRGGIMAPGASLMKSGENGKGLASRWYPETLCKRIKALTEVKEKFTIVQGDAFDLIGEWIDDEKTLFFIDPPYTAGGKGAGRRLYGFHQVDHAALFKLLAGAKGKVMMTYDDSAEVRTLAAKHGFHLDEVPMKNTHHATMIELVITN